MRFPARTGRRIAVGMSLAFAAVLLPTAALASSAESSAPTRSLASQCQAPSTTVWDAQPGNAAAGPIYFDLEFSNTGRQACTFFGYPGISALDSHSNQVGLPAARMRPTGPTITLQPGGTAHVILKVGLASAICQHPVKAVQLKIYPPGQRSAQTLPFATQACPGHSVLAVDALQPNTGIPNYQGH